MINIYEHIRKTCPHSNNRSRCAIRNNRLDVYIFKFIQNFKINDDLKKNCNPYFKRDVKKYQKMIQNGSIPPAIVITEDNQIIDGAHRLKALINLGYTNVDVIIGKLK